MKPRLIYMIASFAIKDRAEIASMFQRNGVQIINNTIGIPEHNYNNVIDELAKMGYVITPPPQFLDTEYRRKMNANNN